MGYILKEVNRKVGKAIHSYRLLSHGDRILVAVSGGADSLLTLWFLVEWLKKAPISYELVPVHLDMGFGGHGARRIQEHIDSYGLNSHIEYTDFGPRSHSPFNRKKSPCFLCAMMRRKRLFELCKTLDCNKIAFGHNMDDLIETFFMNLCYTGELSTMVPKQEMFKGLITLIRPLALVEKPKIERLARKLSLPVVSNPCPSAKNSTRTDIRRLLEDIYRINPKAKGNIMRALSHVRLEYLLTQSPQP